MTAAQQIETIRRAFDLAPLSEQELEERACWAETEIRRTQVEMNGDLWDVEEEDED